MVGCCRRPGRGTNTGLSCVGLQGSGSLRPEYLGLLNSTFFLLAFTVRVTDVPFDTVRMCFAGGMNANVFTLHLRGWHRHEGCHSPAVLPRWCHWRSAVCAHLLPLAGWLWLVLLPRCFVPAPCFRRRVVLRAGGPSVRWLLCVSLRHLRHLHLDRLVASPFVFPSWSWGLPPSRAGYKYGAHHAGIS